MGPVRAVVLAFTKRIPLLREADLFAQALRYISIFLSDSVSLSLSLFLLPQAGGPLAMILLDFDPRAKLVQRSPRVHLPWTGIPGLRSVALVGAT